MNSKELLIDARDRNYAIPAANFIDLDSARAYVDVAERRGLPLILAFAQSHSYIISLEEAAVIGKYLADKARVPVVLHLDHGEDKEFIYRAIDLGFESVMIDASQAPFEDNVKITKEVVEYAHSRNVTVEAELGHVGANDKSEAKELTESIYTDPNDVVEFVERTNVDSLAVSIGTAHGLYKGTPKISFERLEEIVAVTDTPLVLHGGSSSGDENLNKCAKGGITKINIYSDFINGAYQAIKASSPEDYIDIKKIANKAMEDVLEHYYDVFETKPFR